MLPGTGSQPASRTRVVVRRSAPFVAIAGILALQALISAGPVVAFPLYLIAVLFVSLQQSRAESIGAGAAAAVALLLLPLIENGRSSDVPSAILLAAVLVGVAIAIGELSRHSREAAEDSYSKLAEATAGENRLRSMVDEARVGLAISDLEGRWIEVNESLAALLGRTRDELMRTTLVRVTAESEQTALLPALDLLRSGDVTRWDGELDQVRPDGTLVPVGVSLRRIPNADGDPILLVQETDLSARKRADALRDGVLAIRHVIVSSISSDQAMPQLLAALGRYLGWNTAQYWAIDPDRQGLRVRHAWTSGDARFEHFMQTSKQTVVGGTGLLGRAMKAGVLAAEEDLEKGGAEYDRREIARAVGLRSVVAFPVADGGDAIGVIELACDRARAAADEDATMLARTGLEIGQFIRRSEVAQALRRSEADHRTIYERSPIGIARISSDGELLEANPALLHMLGHDEATMRTSAWPDLLRAFDHAASRQHKAPMLAGITDASSIQIRAATGSGNWLWLQLTATSIPDATGRPEHVLVLVEDVTTVRETSDKLAEALAAQQDANTNLEKLDRTKSEFLSIVSHEFRTALTGIQGFSELIRDGGLEVDEVRAYGGYIFNDADRVNRLIGDMLDLDRMESGRMTMRTAAVDINDVLTEAIGRAAPSADTVEFKSDLDARMPIVAGDRDRLIQVISNLVNNSVKYSPEGGTVTLSSRVEGGFALVSVTDTGIGIPADEIGHVFERFRRVRSGAAQSIPGTGLGLTIVKQIVEMHGGKIWVESALSHGSSFHFTIPLAAEGAIPMQLRHA